MTREVADRILDSIGSSTAETTATRASMSTVAADSSADAADAMSQQALSAMRAAIDAKLRQNGVYEQIRQLVHAKAATQRESHASAAAASTANPLALEAADVATTDKRSDDEEQLVRDVLESEVVQQLLQAVKSMRLSEAGAGERELQDDDDVAHDADTLTQSTGDAVDEREMYLFLRLAGGKAFVDQLLADEEERGQGAADAISLETQLGQVRSFFRVVVTFQNQRQSSKDTPCCVDPLFDDYFRFRIEKRKTRSSMRSVRAGASGGARHTPFEVQVVSPWEALCLIDEAVQIDVVKVSKRLVHWSRADGPRWQEVSRELLAVHRLDWRRVLCSTLQLVHLPVALVGKMKVPIGSLDFRADVLHFKRTAAVARDVSAFLNKETLQRNTLNHAFYQYAKQWWDEYRNDASVYEAGHERSSRSESKATERVPSPATRTRLQPRLVKLFAEDDDGRVRMVCKFLTPLRAPAAIKSPSEAARFVGLLPFEADSVVGGARDETWRSSPAFLSLGKGDAQDHALLLASLLLGCGLDAFVCIGTIASEKTSTVRGDRSLFGGATEIGHVWVLTRGASADGSSDDVVFWESTTGERSKLREASVSGRRHGYCSIDCVFSHSQFFANLQPRAWRLRDTSFCFEDASAWKAMDEAMIADLPLAQPPFPLAPPDVAALSGLERDWTLALRRHISSRRRADGYTTRWSDALSFYLLPALNAYELERLYGVPQVDNALFQQSITRFVPDGHTFQGVPVMLATTVASEPLASALDALERNELAVQILELHARGAQFGTAVRCFAYPESVVVVWAMLAVSYESSSS